MKFGFIPTEGGRFYPEALAEVEHAEALGFDFPGMPHPHVLRELELLVREVFPAFR